MFSTFFGIPLSLGALLTGIGLGLGTKWGVLRYPWTTAKLILILTVILMGAFILGPSVEQMRDGSGEAEGRILLGAIWDLVALGTATVLSVFKPGKARRASRSRAPAPGSRRTERSQTRPRSGRTPSDPASIVDLAVPATANSTMELPALNAAGQRSRSENA